ncbi:MAG TPA: DUF5666 domain-containing protein [Casimicrobiaceae bacterium]|nr:DUF5666 domain-containing protein [Casimicrobiaceae bacterium]
MKRTGIRMLFVAALACMTTHALAQTARPIHGDVVGIDGRVLHLQAADGQTIDVALADDARVGIRAPRSLDDIKQGAFVGATAKPDASGTLVASEVHIFPEAQRGTGEGHYPMKSNPGNTMTNATVANVSKLPARTQGSVTNATVASVGANGGGRMLHLAYKGGEQDILVPRDTPVVLLEQGSLASLTVGAHVIVYATTGPDGRLVASRVSVGKNGSVPPV